MAMSTSVFSAQDILKCQLCETNAHLSFKCVDCNLLICTTCRHKVHSKIKDANMHTIVEIKELGRDLLGTPEDVKRNLELVVMKEYTTELDACHFIAASSDGSYFVAQSTGNKSVITKIQIDRNSIKTHFKKEVPNIADIDTLQPCRCILLANYTPTLKMLNEVTGDISESQFCYESLNIIAVHVTMDNKVVVGAKSPKGPFSIQSRSVVLMMTLDGKHQAECEYNQQGDRLFSSPKPTASVKNGNIFVRDQVSGEGRGQVIVLSPTSDVLNTYTGHPDINNKHTPFTPAGMTRTPSDNVIVCDVNNHVLHLINNAGVPLSTIKTGIQFSYCVIFDTRVCDTLYVGCTTLTGCTKKAKLYQINCAEVG